METTNNAQSDDLVTGQGKNIILGTTKELLYMRNAGDFQNDFKFSKFTEQY